MEAMLRKADRSDIPLIVSVQRKAFLPLYEIYRDDGSPELESEEKVAARFEAAGNERLTLVKYEKYTRNNESVCNKKPICKSNGDKVSDFSN